MNTLLFRLSLPPLFLSPSLLPLILLQDGTKLASGGADNAGRLFDVTTGQPTQFARHEGPIKGLRWIDGPNIVATGSWDKTLKVIAGQPKKVKTSSDWTSMI